MFLHDSATLAPGMLEGASLVIAYTVFETVDEYGRRGDLVGVFLDKNEAETANSHAGWFGGNGELGRANVLVLKDGRKFALGSMTEFPEFGVNLPAEKRRRIAEARAKLTDEEAELLGINS